MKDDFLMIKKYIEDKKVNLKRKCVLDTEETPAKKLKNYINSNEIPEKEEGKEITEKSKNIEEIRRNLQKLRTQGTGTRRTRTQIRISH